MLHWRHHINRGKSLDRTGLLDKTKQHSIFGAAPTKKLSAGIETQVAKMRFFADLCVACMEDSEKHSNQGLLSWQSYPCMQT